jgi:hypothetical protein
MRWRTTTLTLVRFASARRRFSCHRSKQADRHLYPLSHHSLPTITCPPTDSAGEDARHSLQGTTRVRRIAGRTNHRHPQCATHPGRPSSCGIGRQRGRGGRPRGEETNWRGRGDNVRYQERLGWERGRRGWGRTMGAGAVGGQRVERVRRFSLCVSLVSSYRRLTAGRRTCRFHAEGSIVTTIFGLLFWDVIFADVPGVFETPYQSAPLDLGEDTFALGPCPHLCSFPFALPVFLSFLPSTADNPAHTSSLFDSPKRGRPESDVDSNRSQREKRSPSSVRSTSASATRARCALVSAGSLSGTT